MNGRNPLRVLLVEDDEDSREAFRRLLTARRYEVHTAEDCRSALDVAARQPIDLLVSDIDLPDGNGCGIMDAVRRMYRVPGIAVTGYGTADVRARCTAAGFVAVLTKPVLFETLVEAVNAAITPG
ncbi:MAG TPA: response regulator [Tepidisphaeraceae bacterium]|nr:response regulator [Tepidisphaeraceae bacterium]